MAFTGNFLFFFGRGTKCCTQAERNTHALTWLQHAIAPWVWDVLECWAWTFNSHCWSPGDISTLTHVHLDKQQGRVDSCGVRGRTHTHTHIWRNACVVRLLAAMRETVGGDATGGKAWWHMEDVWTEGFWSTTLQQLFIYNRQIVSLLSVSIVLHVFTHVDWKKKSHGITVRLVPAAPLSFISPPLPLVLCVTPTPHVDWLQ